MKAVSHLAVFAVLTLATQWTVAQSVFSDNFSTSTINGSDATTPPTTSSTSYDFDSQKTGMESIAPGDLQMKLSSATTGGFIEAEAMFTTTPVTLTPGTSILLSYTFTDTTGTLLAGGTASAIYSGLYNSGGTAPIAGNGSSGNAVSLNGTGAQTGGAQAWQGYVGRIAANGGGSEAYTRPNQTGGSASGTSSAQDLLGNTAFTGAYGKSSPGVQGLELGSSGGTMTSSVVLTAGDQYTVNYEVTLNAANQMTVVDTLSQVGGGTLSTQTSVATGGEFISGLTSFDSLAIGVYNSGTSQNPQMDINDISVSFIPLPEPNSLALLGGGLLALPWIRRRWLGR